MSRRLIIFEKFDADDFEMSNSEDKKYDSDYKDHS